MWVNCSSLCEEKDGSNLNITTIEEAIWQRILQPDDMSLPPDTVNDLYECLYKQPVLATPDPRGYHCCLA